MDYLPVGGHKLEHTFHSELIYMLRVAIPDPFNRNRDHHDTSRRCLGPELVHELPVLGNVFKHLYGDKHRDGLIWNILQAGMVFEAVSPFILLSQ